MKQRTWVNYAVQALAIEGYGHSGKDGREKENARPRSDSRPISQRSLYIGIDREYGYSTEYDPYKPTSPPRRSSSRPVVLNLRPEYNNSAPADVWSDNFEPESPPPIPIPDYDDSFDHDLKNARTECEITFSSEKGSLYSDSDYCSSDVSEAQTRSSNVTKHHRETSETIFQSSTHLPISIVVTSPVDDVPEPEEIRPALPTNSASFLQPNPNSDPYNNVDTTLLMPPTDNQLDSRKLRKAQEFHEIRKWLIIFLNSKGNKFPRKLRLRMMDAYCIREFDLTPEIVAKFNAEVQDEGVALDAQEEELDEAASLSILGAAFRSKIEEALPRREKVVPLPPPPSWQRQGNSPNKFEPKKPASIKVTEVQCSTIPEESEDLDMNLVPSWLGPLISTSTTSRDSLLSDQQYLKRAYSAPNLNPSRSGLTNSNSTHSVPGLRARGDSVNGDADKSKRRGFLSGAFGAMRDAMSGKSSKKEDKPLKKQTSWSGR